MTEIMELAEKGPLVTLNEKSGIFCINKNYRDDVYDETLIKTWIYDTIQRVGVLI